MSSITPASKSLNLLPTHEKLASSVKSRHQALDQHRSLRRLVSAGVSLPEYVRVIRLLQQCFCLVEPALVKYEQSGLSLGIKRYTCKLAALRLDLQQLGADEKQWSQCLRPICIDSTGAYLGARYVLEGSAQGGVFIANCLEKSLPEICDSAFRFWTLQRQSAMHWPAFLTILAQLDNDVAAQEQAVLAAIDTFDIFLAEFGGGDDVRAD